MQEIEQGKNLPPTTKKQLLNFLERELNRVDPQDTIYTEIRQNAPKFSERELKNLLERFRNTSTLSNSGCVASLKNYNRNCIYNYFSVTGHGGYAEFSRS